MTEFLHLDKEYPIRVYETGPDGRLNLYSLFNYLQDAASNHAIMLGYGRDDLMKQNNFWVLSRMYGEINELPPWGETLKIKTWPRGVDKLFALRDYEVLDKNNRLVALATSSWLIIDINTRRIKRPDSTLINYKNANLGGNALPRNADRLDQSASGGQTSGSFRVKMSDLDVNLHTNNTRYLNWVTDNYPLDFVMNHLPVSAEINYLAESHYNEDIVIRSKCGEENANVYNHSILRAQDNTELCRIRIIWKNSRRESK